MGRIFVEKHKLFTRKGADLYIDKKITLLEALTGFSMEIKHLDGEKINISSSPGDIIASDTIKTVHNKGMPFFKDSLSYGNLFIKFSVEFPKKGAISEADTNALKKILPGPK